MDLTAAYNLLEKFKNVKRGTDLVVLWESHDLLIQDIFAGHNSKFYDLDRELREFIQREDLFINATEKVFPDVIEEICNVISLNGKEYLIHKKIVTAMEYIITGYEKQKSSFRNSDSDGKSVSREVFIGHGRSSVWEKLRDFLENRLKVPWTEFNREPVAGIMTVARLEEMLNSACFALLVLTAEDKQDDGTFSARANVLHETGLFQGRLGFKRAIVLLEDGCKIFSNIEGLTQIRFPKNNIESKFEDVRKVLEREGVIRGISGK